jgi:hypothetical protein
VNVDLDPDARAGWEAMGKRAGGNLTAIANALGRAMLRAVEDDLRDPTWRALADEIAATAWERRHHGDA